VSTLANAMQVLQLIVRLRRDISVTDLATQLDIPKSSASRTLSQMCQHGFLERDPITRAYRPGRIVMEAAFQLRSSRSALALIEAQLDLLVRETGYTLYVDLLDGADSLVIQMRIGGGSLQVYTPPGTRLPAWSTSVGRAILARLDDDRVLQLVNSRLQSRANPHAMQTPKELLARLAEIRKQGWSLSRGEFVANVAGISTSLEDPDTHQIYGLSIALPSQDLTQARIDDFSQALVAATRDIGQQIGDPYWLGFIDPAHEQ